MKDSACQRVTSDMQDMKLFATSAYLRIGSRAADEDVMGAKLPSQLRRVLAELKTDITQAGRLTPLILRPESLGPSFLLGQEHTRALLNGSAAH
ncbi:hypothetical protein [Streptomyces venezuelae]